MGVRGVPFFVVDEKYGVSGAQPADVLLQILEKAWTESRAAQPRRSMSDGNVHVSRDDEGA
jgi:predicted DsbA family dithiol-disulfide isomerase